MRIAWVNTVRGWRLYTLILVAAILATAALHIHPWGGGGGRAPTGGVIALAQVPPELQLPPSTLVAWTYISGMDLDKIAQAIEALGGYVSSKTSDMVEGVIFLNNFEKMDPKLAGVMKTQVYIRAYSKGLLVAYTSAYTPDGLPHLIYVEKLVSGNVPVVKPVVLAALEKVAKQAGYTITSVKYGTTQYNDAKRIYLMWSDYVDAKDYWDTGMYTIDATFTIPKDVKVLAAGFLGIYNPVRNGDYYIYFRLDRSTLYYEWYVSSIIWFTKDITNMCKAGTHRVQHRVSDVRDGGKSFVAIVLVTT